MRAWRPPPREDWRFRLRTILPAWRTGDARPCPTLIVLRDALSAAPWRIAGRLRSGRAEGRGCRIAECDKVVRKGLGRLSAELPQSRNTSPIRRGSCQFPSIRGPVGSQNALNRSEITTKVRKYGVWCNHRRSALGDCLSAPVKQEND